MDSASRMERRLEVFRSFSDEQDATRRFWWSRSYQERLAHTEELRRMNYSDAYADPRLQRLLEIARRP